MNRLSIEARGQVISCLVEGMSIGIAVGVTGVSKNTIVKLLIDVGVACSQYLDRTLRSLPCKVIECDEIWSFGYPRTKNVPVKGEGEFGFGDVWTWTAIDADTKVVPSWLVGRRDNRDCYAFLSDLHSRIAPGPVQLITNGLASNGLASNGLASNGLASYLSIMEPLFSSDRFDYAMLIEMFGGGGYDLRHSPPAYTGIKRQIITGDPDFKRISTSDLEHTKLTTRIGMRASMRLTDAFRKKVENHAAAISLHFMFYNFAGPHATPPRPPEPVSGSPRPWPLGWRITSGPPGRSPRSLD